MAKIENYEDMTTTAKYCLNCKSLVEPDEELNCPECGDNIPLRLAKTEKEVQNLADELLNKAQGRKLKTSKEKMIDEAIDENPHLAKYIREQNTNKVLNKEDINLCKIKWSDKSRLEIHYNDYNEGDTKEVIYKSADMPHPDFLEALYELKNELLYLLELPEEYGDNLEIRGVSSGQGAVITAVKKFDSLGGKAFCINTPHLRYESSIEQGSEETPLPKRTEIMIKKLEEEAPSFYGRQKKKSTRKA